MLKAFGTIFVVGICLGVGSFFPPLGILLLYLTGNFNP